MTKPNVTREVATALLRRLSGFRGYPNGEAGEAVFIEAVQEFCISVDHARALVDAFDENFPTLRELRDQALNLKAKFDPPPDLRKQWEAEYGPPDIEFYKRLQRELAERPDIVEHERMWAAIKQHLKVRTFRDIPIGQCWATARDLGFPLNVHQQEEVERWEHSVPRPRQEVA
jgi:hypothetical protein